MSPRSYFAHSLLVLAALLCTAIPARADTIVLGTGFEADTTGGKTNGSIVGTGGSDIGAGFTTFATNGGLVLLVGGPVDLACNNRGLQSQCLALIDGQTSITSVNTFAPGDYQLMFDLFNFTPLTVTLGNFSQTLNATVPAQTFTFSFTLTSNSQLVFSTTFPTAEATLDNIKLTRLEPTAVPEPTTMLLLGTGLAGIAAKVRKRRKVDVSKEA